MALLQLQQLCLCLCVIIVQLTSSQSTYDVIQQENDVSSCERTELSRMEMTISKLVTDVAELKALNQQQNDNNKC